MCPRIEPPKLLSLSLLPNVVSIADNRQIVNNPLVRKQIKLYTNSMKNLDLEYFRQKGKEGYQKGLAQFLAAMTAEERIEHYKKNAKKRIATQRKNKKQV